MVSHILRCSVIIKFCPHEGAKGSTTERISGTITSDLGVYSYEGYAPQLGA
jgi:hypothetical protein